MCECVCARVYVCMCVCVCVDALVRFSQALQPPLLQLADIKPQQNHTRRSSCSGPYTWQLFNKGTPRPAKPLLLLLLAAPAVHHPAPCGKFTPPGAPPCLPKKSTPSALDPRSTASLVVWNAAIAKLHTGR